MLRLDEKIRSYEPSRCPRFSRAARSSWPFAGFRPQNSLCQFFFLTFQFIDMKRLGDSRLINSTFIDATVLSVNVVVVQIKVSEQ